MNSEVIDIYKKQADAHRKRIAELEAKIDRYEDALVWMAGADVFQGCGKERAGFLKIVRPCLYEIANISEGGADEY